MLWFREWAEAVTAAFPPEWINATLVLALVSAGVVVAVFAYLNHTTRRRYFSFWTVAWLFYAVYLAAAVALLETPNKPWLWMMRSGCLGISAVFMFWGSFQLTRHTRPDRELVFGVTMILLWAYLAAFHVRERMWITAPVFTLLALAGVFTGAQYIRHRRQFPGGTLLGAGFVAWGLHLLAVPFAESSPLGMAGGYLTGAILAVLISIAMVAEQETNVSENNYRELFDLATDALFLLEPRSLQVVEANLAATNLLGRSCSELVNQPITRFLPELRNTHDTGLLLQQVNAPRAELLVARPDGTTIVGEARANLTTCPKGEVIELSIRDITIHKHIEQSLRDTAAKLEQTLAELRRTQQQMVQQERLRALEKMASGVAHDFNNALAKILGFNELLLAWPENLNDKDKVKKFLQMSNAAARDAVQIVNRLREFYRHRKTTDVYQPVDLHQVIEQAVVLTQPRWKDEMQANGATIRLDLDLQTTPAIHGSATDLREVLINLLFNAVDALPSGGTISIATRCDARHVILTVADNGVGMTEEVRQRCLEPFFTTKDKRGTGLGLAIAYGAVQRHGGTIEIASEPGRGTTCTIRLPCSPAGAEPVAPTTVPVTARRVLLVEDDPQVLDFEAQYLRGDGHHVETATDGARGWEKFQAGRFDLVVTDRALPEMSGDQLAAAVKTAHPGTPVLIVTGFHDGRPTTADRVVPKPITQDTLRQMVAQLCAPPTAAQRAA